MLNDSMILESLRGVLDAIEGADLGGVVLWMRPPYQLDGIHESASDRLNAMIQMIEQRYHQQQGDK